MIFLVGGGCAEGATWAKQGVIKRDANFLSYLAHCNLEGRFAGVWFTTRKLKRGGVFLSHAKNMAFSVVENDSAYVNFWCWHAVSLSGHEVTPFQYIVQVLSSLVRIELKEVL